MSTTSLVTSTKFSSDAQSLLNVSINCKLSGYSIFVTKLVKLFPSSQPKSTVEKAFNGVYAY